tara:strand:+ start:27 stop:629 length:603 start_codon:yes stop_codon:yes gene_type:complete
MNENSASLYSKEYFTSINYTDYLNRYDRYKKLARDTSSLLSNLSLINQNSNILDYGCAVGFLLRSYNELNYKNCYGYDISDWAKSKAKEHDVKLLDNINDINFDVTFCLDVIEHMTDGEIDNWLSDFKTNALIVRVPVASVEGGDYHLKVSRQDPTHVNCKTKDGWKTLLKKYGFVNFLNLNLLTIYDTKGVWCALCLKN